MILFIYFLLIFLTSVKCNINKNDTKLFKVNDGSENFEQLNFSETINDNDSLYKTGQTNLNKKSVYLEDIFYSLRSQQWNEDEIVCINHTMKFLNNLQNFTLWSASIWDATASEPRGFLSGSKLQLGNYDECLRPGWSFEEYPELKTQYCLADVKLLPNDVGHKKIYQDKYTPYQSAIDKILNHGHKHRRSLDELQWGACVPASCKPYTVQKLITTLILRSHLAVTDLKYNITVHSRSCQVDRRYDQMPSGAYAFYITCALIILIVAACTTYHWYYINYNPEKADQVSPYIKACSYIKNYKTFISKSDMGLDVLYGIRFLSIAMIVYSHRCGIGTSAANTNSDEIDELPKSIFSYLVLRADLLVDSFLLLSATLTVSAFLNMKRMSNPFIVVLRRYLRLAPALGMVIFFVATTMYTIGDGPMWNMRVIPEAVTCQDNGWTNMLMISNYVNSSDICMVISWYIPVDFHLFLMTVCLYLIYKKDKLIGIAVTLCLMVTSVIIPALVVYYNKYLPIVQFTYVFTMNPRASETFMNVYIKTHMRAAPYFIGIIVGYFITRYPPIKNKNKINLIWSVLGALLGILTMLAAMLVSIPFYNMDNEYVVEEAAVFAALNRSMWTLGLAFLIISCTYGCVPFIGPFLTWYGWIPLSKLAYGLYLIHTVTIQIDIALLRAPQYINPFYLIYVATGDIIIGCILSYILLIFLEMPIQNIFLLIISGNDRRIAPKENSQLDPSSNIENIKPNNSYMPTNLYEVNQTCDPVSVKCR